MADVGCLGLGDIRESHDMCFGVERTCGESLVEDRILEWMVLQLNF